MFNFDFSELMVVGIVALVVIGPERLPKVARMAGYWIGRFQRFMNSLAEDINKEMEIDRLKEIQRKAEQEFVQLDKRIAQEAGEAQTVFAEAEFKINTMDKGGDARPGEVMEDVSVSHGNSKVVEPVSVIEQPSSKSMEGGPTQSAVKTEAAVADGAVGKASVSATGGDDASLSS